MATRKQNKIKPEQVKGKYKRPIPVFTGRPPKIESVEQLEKAINKYFLSCWSYKRDMFGNRIVDKATGNYVMEQTEAYTMTGLAIAVGVDRKTLLNYETERPNCKDFFHTIKIAREKCQKYAENALFVGKNPTGAMFNLKNNYEEWRDKKELDLEPKPSVFIKKWRDPEKNKEEELKQEKK